MKFGRNLSRNQVPEWASAYINYKALKKLIKTAEANNKAGEDPDLALFFFTLDRNLESVDAFYNKKYAESHRRVKSLQDRYGSVKTIQDAIDMIESADLLSALLEVRGQLRNLQWYGEVNRRGFVKITKKLDKKVPSVCAQRRYLDSRVDVKGFASNFNLLKSMNSVNEWISILGDLSKTNGPSSYEDSMSEKFAPNLPSAFTAALDPFIRADNAKMLEQHLSEVLNNKAPFLSDDLDRDTVLLNLLQRAISCRAKTSISFLLSKTKSLKEPNDINERNCIHRLVIAIGRANSTVDFEKDADMVLRSEPDNSDYITPAATPVPQYMNGRGRHARKMLDSSDPLVELLQHLLSNLVSPTQKRALLDQDSHGRSPLHYAAYYGFVIVCKILMQKLEEWDLQRVDANSWQDVEGWNPLQIAIIEGHPLTVQAFLSNSLFSLRNSRNDQSAQKSGLVLSLAVKANYVAIVELLVDAGVDIFYQDSEGETALHIAARFGHSECAKILLDGCSSQQETLRFAEIIENTFSWTALFIAAVDGHKNVIDMLCSYGVDAECQDLSGWTPREHAALRGHIEIARTLAEYCVREKTLKPDPKRDNSSQSASASSNSSLEEKNSSISRGRHQQTSISEPVKAFGHRYLKDESLVLVSLGSMDIRKEVEPVKLDRIPIANAHSTQLDTALSVVVSAKGAQGEPTVIDLPVQDSISTDPIVLTTKDPLQVRLLFDIVPTYSGSKTKIVGRGAAMLGTIKQDIGDRRTNLQGDISVPILAADTLEVIGSVHFTFLIITPFTHPNMKISEGKTYWKSLASTMVIGHRGLGKNIRSRKSLQLGENTIQSFVAAANLGANYIEFDVQLTKDHVPVIYHDFLVSETGIDAPVHTLTLEQFLHVGEAATTKSHRAQSPPLKSDSRLDFIKAANQRGRSYSVGARNDDTVAEMSERMKHTRDFKLKGFKGNSGIFIKDSFTTLEQMFHQVPPGTGFNIEMKYPMLMESQEQEMDTYAIDLNTFVDTVLKTVYEKNSGPDARNIIFSSFNPDICLLLSFKQPSIPILFLTDAGTSPVGDIRATSLQEAIRFASKWNLLGVVTAAYPLVVAPRLIKVVKESGLVCMSYGALNNDPVHVQAQADQEIDAVIVDSLVTVREGLRNKGVSSQLPTAPGTTSAFSQSLPTIA